jgi:hypothetical protein
MVTSNIDIPHFKFTGTAGASQVTTTYGFTIRPENTTPITSNPAAALTATSSEKNFLPVTEAQYYLSTAAHNLPMKADSEVNFYSKEHVGELCLTGSTYTAYNTTAVALDNDVPVNDNYDFYQMRVDPNEDNYDVNLFVKHPREDPFAGESSKDTKTMMGVMETYDGTYLHKEEGEHHYNATKKLNSRNQNCTFGLRMTKPNYTSSSFLTFTAKQ